MLLSKSTSTLLKSTCSCQKRFAHKLVEVELLVDVPNLGLKGSRIPIAPGRARNNLIPTGKALLVVRGKAFSALNDMKRKEESLFSKFDSLLSNNNLSNTKVQGGKKTLESTDEIIDPLAPLILSEKTLLDSLSLLPILQFYRRPINPISTSTTSSLPGQKPTTPTPPVGVKSEIFGSVSEKEILSKFAEFGILVEEGLGKLVSSKNGEEVENSRIKNLGKYKYIVEFKTIKESVTVDIQVLPEV